MGLLMVQIGLVSNQRAAVGPGDRTWWARAGLGCLAPRAGPRAFHFAGLAPAIFLSAFAVPWRVGPSDRRNCLVAGWCAAVDGADRGYFRGIFLGHVGLCAS
jgi:hypothetical protein